ncbi:MAG: hypothetical protein KDA47_17465 [Planctomycetales bacterium]|nr:hypothetical protein [Planctomycetales bacterium]
MARLIALEWDAREARVVVARQRGKSTAFEHAFSVELTPADPGKTFSNLDVAERVGAALAARGIGRGDALVAIGRTSIELRQLALPPCPLEELPDLVRFQAMRQFTNIGEGWPLDFAHIDSGEQSEGSEFHVLAAAIAPTSVEQIRETCEAGGLTPQHLVLRPFAAASLFRRHDQDRSDHCRMLVDPMAVEADLTVLVDEQVGFMRTVRLAEGEAQTAGLVGEIRRTIVAAQNQLAGRRVERIVLCGDTAEQSALRQQLEEMLSLPVEIFDPFEGLNLEGDLAKRLPPHHGRFLPLLGVLLDEAEQRRHAIDFLNPTKRPEAPKQTRRNVLIAATAATLLLAIVGGTWFEMWRLDSQADELRRQSNELDATVKLAQKSRADVATVEAFLAKDVTWLDELRYLSLNFPPPEQAIVREMKAVEQQQGGGGMIELSGFASESSTLNTLERGLRDERHGVLGTGSQKDDSRKGFGWSFKESIVIPPEDHTDRFDITVGPADEPPTPPNSETTQSNSATKPAPGEGGQI